MKFNNALLACILFSSLIFSCAENPKKSDGVSVKMHTENTLPEKNLASALPAGPMTANPYLQTKTKVSAATQTSFASALSAMQQKNWAQAETLLQQLAATNPTLSGVQLNLGIVYRRKLDNAKAAEAFAEAIRINPKNLDAYNQLGILKREAGDFSEAEKLYQSALNVWPFHADSHKNIAILYELYMGKAEQALPHYLAYQQLLSTPDKQVNSWIADLQRRLHVGKKPTAESEKNDQDVEKK